MARFRNRPAILSLQIFCDRPQIFHPIVRMDAEWTVAKILVRDGNGSWIEWQRRQDGTVTEG